MTKCKLGMHALVVWLIQLLHCMLLGMMIAVGLFFWPLPQSSGGNFVRSVHALFHSDVSRYHFSQGQPSRCRLNTSVLCSPQAAQMHSYLSVHSLKFAIFGINFSFCVGFRARHNFRLLINRYRSQIDLPALLPLTHTTCVTQRARGQY